MILQDKYAQISVQAKASIWYTICNFFQKGIVFFVVPIYIRLLSTDEYGVWSVFQSWTNILIVFASLNLYAGVYTKTLVDIPDSKSRDTYTSSMQGLGTLITLVMAVIYLFAREQCNKLLRLDTTMFLLMLMYFIVYPSISFWSTRQRVEYKYRSMVIVTIILSLFTPCVSLLLVKYTNMGAQALIFGYLSTQTIVSLPFYIYHFYKGKCFFNLEYWKYAARFNVPLVPHYLSLIVLGQSDRIMIEYMCGESDAGIYSFAYQIASAINVMIAAVNGSRVPWTYEQLKNRIYSGLRRITNSLVLMMSGITLLMCLVTPEIVSIIGTDDYSIARYVIPVVAIGLFYTFVYDLYASVEFYYGATQYVMYASVTGAILNLVLNYIFIPIFGMVVAAYTTLVCYIVFMLMHYLFSKIVIRKQNISNTLYDNRMVFLISVFITLIGLMSMMAFDYPIVRIASLLIIGLVCFIKRKTIVRLVRSIRKGA